MGMSVEEVGEQYDRHQCPGWLLRFLTRHDLLPPACVGRNYTGRLLSFFSAPEARLNTYAVFQGRRRSVWRIAAPRRHCGTHWRSSATDSAASETKGQIYPVSLYHNTASNLFVVWMFICLPSWSVSLVYASPGYDKLELVESLSKVEVRLDCALKFGTILALWSGRVLPMDVPRCCWLYYCYDSIVSWNHESRGYLSHKEQSNPWE